MTPEQILAEPLGRFRSTKSKGLKPSDEPRVVRDGGDFGAGLIRGFSMITRGEALGHDMWIDSAFLDQTAAASAAAGDKGLKVRFTHPGLSSDGMGKLLGRVKNGRREGDQVYGDLHISPTAHETPDGNLAKYVMDLAESDPEAFGASIVFQHDRSSQDAFHAEHEEEFDYQDARGNQKKGKRFKSPDPLNKKNLRHARLAELHATDIVDDPAANPNGLFHRPHQLADEASQLAAFALGLPGAERPSLSALDMDPDRIAAFAKRFLDQHGLTLAKKDSPAMSTETKPADQPTREQLRAEEAAIARMFTAKFGANGATWYSEGLSYEQALEKHCDALSARIVELEKEKTEAAEQLAALDRGESQPAGSTDPDTKAGGGNDKKPLSSFIRIGASKPVG